MRGPMPVQGKPGVPVGFPGRGSALHDQLLAAVCLLCAGGMLGSRGPPPGGPGHMAPPGSVPMANSLPVAPGSAGDVVLCFRQWVIQFNDDR
jgi:hypothetical protein